MNNPDKPNTVGDAFQRISPQINEKNTALGGLENLLARLQKYFIELSPLLYFVVFLPFIYPLIFLCLGIPAAVKDAFFKNNKNSR